MTKNKECILDNILNYIYSDRVKLGSWERKIHPFTQRAIYDLTKPSKNKEKDPLHEYYLMSNLLFDISILSGTYLQFRNNRGMAAFVDIYLMVLATDSIHILIIQMMMDQGFYVLGVMGVLGIDR